jgi:hypothetical protein
MGKCPTWGEEEEVDGGVGVAIISSQVAMPDEKTDHCFQAFF